MLSRQSITDGSYLDAFPDLPGQPRWSAQQIEASMHATLAKRPKDSPVWLFGYGSLIWNPQIHFLRQQEATLMGWQRSFCLRLLAGRGSPEQPGRMLALKAGGTTHGVIFELEESSLYDEMRFVWVREMVYGSYTPTWAEVTTVSGETLSVLVFVADPTHTQYQEDSCADTVSALISKARGPLGSNIEYLDSLKKTLEQYGICDPYIQALTQAVHPSREHDKS